MKIQKIDNTNFGTLFKLSNATLNAISRTTKLSEDELHRLPMAEAIQLMKDRAVIKEPSKFKLWLAEKYKQFGERNGLLKKQYSIYTDVD